MTPRPASILSGAPGFTAPQALGFLLASAWLARNSLLTYYAPSSLVALLCTGLLLACALLLLVPPVRVRWPGLTLVVAALPGSVVAEEPGLALPRYLGWACLLAVVGPVVSAPALPLLRNSAWRAAWLGVFALSLASAAWGALGLPVLGRGAFTGVLNHANLLGPIAGLGAALALRCWFAGAPWPALAVAAVCAAACVSAAARIALAALIITTLLLVAAYWRTAPRASVYLYTVGGACILALFLSPRLPIGIGSALAPLRQKGFQHTRAEHWSARWTEFRARPMLGNGIGAAQDYGSERDLQGQVTVEPGSGWLAVLSMTGLTGAAALTWLFAHLLRCVSHIRAGRLVPDLIDPVVTVVFLGVHALGEGWFFAVGSPLALLFWLALGLLSDRLDPPSQCASSSGKIS